MASKLTDRQQQILDLIRQTVARTLGEDPIMEEPLIDGIPAALPRLEACC